MLPNIVILQVHEVITNAGIDQSTANKVIVVACSTIMSVYMTWGGLLTTQTHSLSINQSLVIITMLVSVLTMTPQWKKK